MNMDPETRRGIAQRALGRARVQGVALEEDQVFMDLLDQWIEGNIPMRLMRERYLEAFAQRERERRPKSFRTDGRTQPNDPTAVR